MPDFSKAHVGDSVYDIRYGHGKITHINPGDDYSIVCYFKEVQEQETYTIDGRTHDWHIGPVLFHAKPEISDPPPPKRMIKRKAWLNINKLSKTDTAVYTHGTKEQADAAAVKSRIACIPIEWEEEE
jgi:hypothetical protein